VLGVVDMVDKIEFGFKSKFGPFDQEIRDDEQEFKNIFHRRILARMNKLGVRTLFAPGSIFSLSFLYQCK
jgi:hypothetical protein